MKKIINFFHEKYKLLIPIMVVLVLLITTFFLYKEYKFDNQRNKNEVEVFQYLSSMRVDYTGVFTYNLKNAIVDFKAKNAKIEDNIFPIYYKDMSKVVFPVTMSIIFPLRDGKQYKLYKYATYYKQDDVHFIKHNEDVGNYSDFFLFNGKDTFFFPDETVLKIGDKEYKKLGPMSYVRVVGGVTLIYYDTATESSEVLELNGKKVYVTSDIINLNVSDKYFYSFSNKLLLLLPNNLNPVFKTIDK